jgi:hypothetical protein
MRRFSQSTGTWGVRDIKRHRVLVLLGPDASAPDLAADGATLLSIASGLVRLR